MKRTFLHLVPLVFAALALPAPVTALAQTYPDKPVRILVGYSPGGLPDTVARIVAHRLGERWGQQAIVENRPGANAGIAADLAIRAPADGYTLLVTDNSTTAINPFLYKKLAYDAKELLPVALLAQAPLFLALHPSVPAQSLQELVALVKANPGKYAYGSSGIGSTHHLCMEYLKSALGLDITHVPFKGTGQSVPAAVAGQVGMVFSAYPSLAAYAKDGRVKLLVANSLKRAEFAAQIPTISETVPGFDFAPTIGIFAPRATPRAVVAKINADANAVVRIPDTVSRMINLGIIAAGSTPEEYAAALAGDAERYARAIKLSGAKAE